MINQPKGRKKNACVDCGAAISNSAKRCRPCSAKRISRITKGHPNYNTELKGCYKKGNVPWIKGKKKPPKIYGYCSDCGEEISRGAASGKCAKCADGRFKKGNKSWTEGKKRSLEVRKKISETRKRKIAMGELICDGSYLPHFPGEKNPNWRGGKSIEPYAWGFGEELKNKIRTRDGYVCQVCFLSGFDKALSVHHIDYNKENHDENNLISLCRKCHGATNYNRKYWQNVLSEKIMKGVKHVYQSA